jgi:hypothetical protein
MPAGATSKREREYEKLKREFKQERRYPGREEEVAARIVNQQRAKFGEMKEAKRKERHGKSPDRDLPVKDYQHLTIDQITDKLDKLSSQEIKEVKRYEQKHKNRKTLLKKLASRD